jgi:hypothetical protein
MTELILFSHNRTYVLQKPILTEFSEESVMCENRDDVVVTYFYIPMETSVFERKELHLKMIKDLLGDEGVEEYTIWTNRARMVSLIRHLNASSIIYDRNSDNDEAHPQHLEEMRQYAELQDQDLFSVDDFKAQSTYSQEKIIERRPFTLHTQWGEFNRPGQR